MFHDLCVWVVKGMLQESFEKASCPKMLSISTQYTLYGQEQPAGLKISKRANGVFVNAAKRFVAKGSVSAKGCERGENLWLGLQVAVIEALEYLEKLVLHK